jgi:hypothetical protein
MTSTFRAPAGPIEARSPQIVSAVDSYSELWQVVSWLVPFGELQL